jgi:hypothetical protein
MDKNNLTIQVGTKASGKLAKVEIVRRSLGELVAHFGEDHILDNYYKSRSISEANKVRGKAKAKSVSVGDMKIKLMIDGHITLDDAKASGDNHIASLYKKHYGQATTEDVVVEW